MAEIMGFPLGMCPTHGPKLAVNGVPTCIKCQADEANKDRVLVVNEGKDPGPDAFGSNGQLLKAGTPPSDRIMKPVVKVVGTPHTYEGGLQEILTILSCIPMPSSMKQYKLLMSVKQKIESALQEG
jgi:hypothetical protein